MRFRHVLTRNDDVFVPRYYVVFDTETRQRDEGEVIENELELGWAVFKDRETGQEEWWEFRDPAFFWSRLNSFPKRLYIFAHNLFFDFMVVQGFKYLKQMGFRIRKLINKSFTFVLDVRRDKDKRHWTFINTGNYFTVSLKKLGMEIGLQKLEMPSIDETEALSVYCRRDVEVLLKVLEEWFDFIEREDLGRLAYTTAGQAFNAFRHRFLNSYIVIHGDTSLDEFERLSYFGGRTEVFRLGKHENVYYLDVNSMYPFVMRSNPYPIEFLYEGDYSADEVKRIISRGDLVIARVKVDIDKPFLPYKMNGKLVFPVGRFETVVATPEVELIFRYAKNYKFEWVAVYKGFPIFKNYVDYFYEMKQKAKGFRRRLYKLMLNSLYGKFGQRDADWKKVAEADSYEFKVWTEVENGKRRTYRQVGNVIEKRVADERAAINSFIAIASHVTSYARAYLWESFMKVGLENVLYCDTDSMMVTEEGFKRFPKDLIDDSELGKWKLEERFRWILIKGAKDYEYETWDGRRNLKLKGVRKEARKLSKEEVLELVRQYNKTPVGRRLKKMLEINPDADFYLMEQWLGISYHLRKGVDKYRIRRIVKVVKHDYDKGEVDRVTGKVEPFNLREW